MKLTEALALVAGTDRGIRIAGESYDYELPVDMSFGYEDLSIDTWEVEPEVITKTFTVAELKQAWETARSGMVSVKRAEESKLFNNLKVVLFG